MSRHKYLLLLIAGICFGPRSEVTASDSAPVGADGESSVAEAAAAAVQARLLDLAFLSASQIPVEPHIKGRSRIQESVVLAAIEADMPDRAEYFAKGIGNWRRGHCFAQLAFEHAGLGNAESARRFIAEAEAEAAATEDWRRDRIRVAIARTRAALGESLPDEAEFEASERGRSYDARLAHADTAELDQLLAALDLLLEDPSFDVKKNALVAYASYYGSPGADAGRRNRIEAGLRKAWADMPVLLRLDLTAELCAGALRHSDPDKSRELIAEACELIDAHVWPLEHELPLRSKLAVLRCESGEPDAARQALEAAVGLYDLRKGEIYDIWRADALRPVAAGFARLGDDARAAELYLRTLNAGAENPNSFPKAEDLVETCLSMARAGFEPDSGLMTRMLDIHAKLDHPW